MQKTPRQKIAQKIAETPKKQLTWSRRYGIVGTRDKLLALFFMLKINGDKRIRGGSEMRTKITLACTECKQRNYNTTKEKKNHPDRMEVRKYCRFCRKHTVHKETK